MKRVFLSFLAEDKKQVDGVRLLAANPRFALEFYDESVKVPYDSENADYIKRGIREKIARTSVTVCFVSAQTYTSAWVNWELEESFARNNRVIAMGLPNGPGQLALPAALRERQQPWWAWNLDDLVARINA